MEIKIKKTNKDAEIKKPKARTRTRKTTKTIEKQVTETIEDIDKKIDNIIEKTQEPETIEIAMPLNINSIDWKYEIKEKSIPFYFLLFSWSAIFIFLGYQYNNWILTLIVILGFVMIIQKNSKIENFKIDSLGITLQDHEVEWNAIETCSIETLDDNTLLITIIPITFPRLKLYVPFQKEMQREIIYLINKYSKLTEVNSNIFDQIVKKIMF